MKTMKNGDTLYTKQFESGYALITDCFMESVFGTYMRKIVSALIHRVNTGTITRFISRHTIYSLILTFYLSAIPHNNQQKSFGILYDPWNIFE